MPTTSRCGAAGAAILNAELMVAEGMA